MSSASEGHPALVFRLQLSRPRACLCRGTAATDCHSAARRLPASGESAFAAASTCVRALSTIRFLPAIQWLLRSTYLGRQFGDIAGKVVGYLSDRSGAAREPCGQEGTNQW